MTRVNVVPVTELCDQHLLAEHREITRIPNQLISGKLKLIDDRPDEYTLGDGHIKFFTDKLRWLFYRHLEVHEECKRRGMNVQNIWPPELAILPHFAQCWNDWKVTPAALRLNRARIRERMPVKARWSEA